MKDHPKPRTLNRVRQIGNGELVGGCYSRQLYPRTIVAISIPDY